jgi:hypothetical protein
MSLNHLVNPNTTPLNLEVNNLQVNGTISEGLSNFPETRVSFNPSSHSGGFCTILGTPHNVASVTYTATGSYVVNFVHPLPSANAVVQCTSQTGVLGGVQSLTTVGCACTAVVCNTAANVDPGLFNFSVQFA